MAQESAAVAPSVQADRVRRGQDDHQLFLRHARGDAAAGEALVERFMPLARGLARRYGRSSEPLDDLVQVAAVGLLKALDRFEPNLGYRFSAFAIPTILGELRRHFRSSGWCVHVPRGTQELALEVREAHDHFTAEHGRAPTVDQLARELGLDVEKVIDALQAVQAYQSVSLDAPRPSDVDDSETYVDSIGQEDARYELAELNATLASALRQVPERERAILRMRFVEDLTQTEIGTRMGISQMQVSRVLRRSLEQIRALTEESLAA